MIRTILLFFTISFTMTHAKSVTYRRVKCLDSSGNVALAGNLQVKLIADNANDNGLSFKIIGNAYGFTETYYCAKGSSYSDKITQSIESLRKKLALLLTGEVQHLISSEELQFIQEFFDDNLLALLNLQTRFQIGVIKLSTETGANYFSPMSNELKIDYNVYQEPLGVISIYETLEAAFPDL